MQGLRILALVFAALLGLTIVARADCTNPQTIEELRDCWQQDWNQKDVNALAKLYSNDASLLTGDGRFDGIEKIKTYLQSKINSNPQLSLITSSHVEPIEYGYDSGSFQTTPQSQPQDGNYLFVARKAKGKLHIVQHAFVAKKPGTVTAPCVTCFL